MPSSHNFSAAVLAQPYIFTTFGVVALQDSVPHRIRAHKGGKMTSPAPAPILLAIRAGLRCSSRPICPPSCLLLLLPLAPDTLAATAAVRRRIPSLRPPPHMTHYAESSGGGRARSRLQGGRSTRIHSIDFDPVGELSGFPLIVCPECGLDRVVEGRTKKEGENQGRLYFKCARNTVSIQSVCFVPEI